jgi:signal transduction histidine kinase
VISVVAGLALLAAAGLAWAVTLRRRVARQTEQIREHHAREAVAQERVRIARELHDSLQQDLLGITMQLKATDRLLDDPERARAALQLASAMVRRGQAEAHRAIWDLRDTGEPHPNLVATLREVAAGLSAGDAPAVEVAGTGHVRPLPAAVENHVLRIAQEALTNALKHAQAAHIEVELDYAADRVTLHVRDDGRGFDADHPPAAASGHFGLFGMRERAAKLGADLRITSRAGTGTAIHLSVPLAVEPLENHPTQIASALRLAPRPATL